MPKDFFTADTHFYHKNIIKFCPDSRQQITDTNEMNEKLIQNWNSQVSPEDTVYHLGDFSFAGPEKTLKILSRLNGYIHLIKGNHDHWLNQETRCHLSSVQDYKLLRKNRQKVILFHYPIAEWDCMQHGSFHLYGHVHGSLTLTGRALDVGIDARPHKDMKLWEWQEIVDTLSKKPIKSHH